MKIKTVVLWWLINNREHSHLSKKDRRIESVVPIVVALFPGVNYFSFTGFSDLMKKCVRPALKKMFPELVGAGYYSVHQRMMSEVTAFLPSKGYEWQRDPEWMRKFDQLIAAEKSH